MSEMIERVAEAMRLRAIERGHPVHPVMIHHLAAAAIEAMRDPTQEMLAAALALDGVNHGVLVPAGPADAWEAMIDQALAEPGPLRPPGSADLYGVPRAEE